MIRNAIAKLSRLSPAAFYNEENKPKTVTYASSYILIPKGKYCYLFFYIRVVTDDNKPYLKWIKDQYFSLFYVQFFKDVNNIIDFSEPQNTWVGEQGPGKQEVRWHKGSLSLAQAL